ncbi:MAG: hypothetical protein MK101_11165 [Phycisphaerales bacterium]|nr:hypothetical protein [Phycisphaerales bacterium]
MAKMFYTLEEVCQRLGKSRDEIEAMVASGEIQEFRDGESLVFKVEQIDVLAASDESGADIDLDLSGASFDLGDSAGLDLSASGSAELDLDLDLGGDPAPAASHSPEPSPADPPTPLPDQAPRAVAPEGGDDLDLSGGLSLEGSSMDAFDLGGSDSGSLEMTEPGGFGDELDLSAELAAPPAAADSGEISSLDLGEAGETRVGEGIDDGLTLESVGSGSGLLDLTRESDDTSLGAELLEEVYSSDDDFVDVPAASGLFEAADASGAGGEAISGSNEAVGAAAPVGGVAVAQQAWDPAGSGLSAGMCIGALVCLLGVFAIVGVQLIGGSSGLAPLIAEKLWIWTGGIAGGTVLLGLIGLFIGKRGG